MPPRLRKAALVTHVTSSAGWLGAVAAFLAMAVAALHTTDVATMRSLYVAMDLVGWAALVPLAAATFVTGLVQALGTTWGLFRHWWVVVKLAITLVATAILLAYTSTLGLLSAAAQRPEAHPGLLPTTSPVLHGAGALLVLVAAVVLSLYKPRGVTRHGWRTLQAQRARATPAATDQAL